MAFLATTLRFPATIHFFLFRRFHNIAGWRFRRIRRVFQRLSQLQFQFHNPFGLLFDLFRQLGDKLTKFTIAGTDGRFVPAEAVIEGDTIVVSSESVKVPVAVQYAWGAADRVNLFNKEGLPASSFRTEIPEK